MKHPPATGLALFCPLVGANDTGCDGRSPIVAYVAADRWINVESSRIDPLNLKLRVIEDTP